MLGSPHSYAAAFSALGTRGRANAPISRFIRTNAAPNPTKSVNESRISIRASNILCPQPAHHNRQSGSGDGNVARRLRALELLIVPRDPVGLALDRSAQAIDGAQLPLVGIPRQPARPLIVCDRKRQRAIPELRQVLHDPPPPREDPRQA